MDGLAAGMTWKEIAAGLMKDFIAWGCRYDRKKLPEIAMGYDCTTLFFWNWMDDPELPRTERGFLRVLGYAWRRQLEEEGFQDEKEAVPVRAASRNDMAA